MVRVISFLLLVILTSKSFTQPHFFVKKWDKRFGGFDSDALSSYQQTSDGGFVLCGFSSSGMNGDKSQDKWDTQMYYSDYWVIKIDSDGNKQWDKRFGGTGVEVPGRIIQTKDKGYIMGSHSTSGLSGDKTQPRWGMNDLWIVKTDSTGNKLWDKRFGGTLDDFAGIMIETSDNGYILGGSSNSPANGDITEDDRDPTHFYSDIWIVKIDSVGNKQWDKRYGGTEDDGVSNIYQTADNGYFLVGGSNSSISGDKTEANWDTTHPISWDGWILKIDSIGNKLWDKRYGGTEDDALVFMQPSSSGTYILCGSTKSPANGDKTTPKTGYWLLEIDTLGNKLWDKVFSDATFASNRGFSKTTDNGYLISGVSVTNAANDKSENNLGPYQVWIIKTDSLLNKQWDKTIFTTKRSEGYAIQTTDGCYAVGTWTGSGIGGYKTQANWDTTEQTYDYWILKFCMDTVTGINELTDQPQITIYPNPFATDVSISIQKENLHQATFTITNLIGQTIYHQEETNLANSYTKMLDLSYLPNDIYFVTVQCKGETITKKIIKQ